MQLTDVLRLLQRQPESSLEQKPLRYHTRSEQWLTDVTWTLAAPNPLASHSLYREPQTPVLFLGSGVTCWNTAPPPSQTQKPQKPSVITSEGQAQLTWTAGSSLPPQRQPTGSCSCWSFCSLMEQRTLHSNLQTGAEPLACTAESDEAPPCASPSQAQKRLHSPSRLSSRFRLLWLLYPLLLNWLSSVSSKTSRVPRPPPGSTGSPCAQPHSAPGLPAASPAPLFSLLFGLVLLQQVL